MSELANKIVKLLSYGYHTNEQVITMMNYLIQEGNAKKPMQFIMDIAKQSQKHEEALMTIAQSLRQEGLKEGVQQGKKEASIEIARQLLEKGVEREIIKNSTGLNDIELNQLFVR